MRLFRKIKRKFSKKCRERFDVLKKIRKHRFWLYSARKFVESYFYSDVNFEDDFKHISKIKYKDAFETASDWCKFFYFYTKKYPNIFEKEESYYMIEFFISDFWWYMLSKNKTVCNPSLMMSFKRYCFFENNKQFMQFWDIYSQATFWKKYKVWLKMQEIYNDF